jgi:hypothetical protein
LRSLFLRRVGGLDHGVGHPLLLLCHAKAPNYLKKKGFKDLLDYPKWPKVADAVIETLLSIRDGSPLFRAVRLSTWRTNEPLGSGRN